MESAPQGQVESSPSRAGMGGRPSGGETLSCPFGRGISAMVMAGQCTPHFLFFWAQKKRKRAVHGPKEKKTLGARICPFGQILAQNTGVGLNRYSEDPDSLLPGASDSVPCGGTLPQLQLSTRLFCIFDARPLTPLPALCAWPAPCGQIPSFTGWGGGQRSSVRPIR